MKWIVRYTLIVAMGWTLAATSAVAQDNASHVYFTGGIGGGRFTPKCDTGCFGTAMNSNSMMLVLGYHMTPRIRGELMWLWQPATGVRSHAASISVGLAAYVVGNLYVRGGVSQLDLSVEDSIGVSEGKSKPGFVVGAGYDLFLSHKFAITPYVNFFSGSIKTLTYDNGGPTVTTSGSVTAISGGISFTYRAWRHQ